MTNLLSAALGHITQGVIFNAARADNYAGCSVAGLVITARCDVAHDKVSIVNYLPIVQLDDWIHRDGCQILAARASKQCHSGLKQILNSMDYSTGIIDYFSKTQIVEKLFSVNDKRTNDTKEKFLTLHENWAICREALERSSRYRHVGNLADKFPKLASGIIEELIKHRLTGYYFLPRIDLHGDDLGHVVLLREIRYLTYELALAVAKGLSEKEYRAMASAEMEFLRLEGDGFSMPLSIVASPDIEHIMQCFSLLFSRIGLADPDPNYIKSIWERLPSLTKGTEA